MREEFAKASCSFMDDADYEEGEKITVKYKNGINTNLKFFKFPTFNITQQWKNNGLPSCNAVLNNFGNNVVDGGNKKKNKTNKKAILRLLLLLIFFAVFILLTKQNIQLLIFTQHILSTTNSSKSCHRNMAFCQ